MALCGWRSRTVLERYNIVRPEDAKAGIARRFNSTLPAHSASPETEPDHVYLPDRGQWVRSHKSRTGSIQPDALR